MTLYDQLPPDVQAAVDRVRGELFPTASADAVVRKLLRDALIGMGIMRLGAKNRSQGARRARR